MPSLVQTNPKAPSPWKIFFGSEEVLHDIGVPEELGYYRRHQIAVIIVKELELLGKRVERAVVYTANDLKVDLLLNGEEIIHLDIRNDFCLLYAEDEDLKALTNHKDTAAQEILKSRHALYSEKQSNLKDSRQAVADFLQRPCTKYESVVLATEDETKRGCFQITNYEALARARRQNETAIREGIYRKQTQIENSYMLRSRELENQLKILIKREETIERDALADNHKTFQKDAIKINHYLISKQIQHNLAPFADKAKEFYKMLTEQLNRSFASTDTPPPTLFEKALLAAEKFANNNKSFTPKLDALTQLISVLKETTGIVSEDQLHEIYVGINELYELSKPETQTIPRSTSRRALDALRKGAGMVVSRTISQQKLYPGHSRAASFGPEQPEPLFQGLINQISAYVYQAEAASKITLVRLFSLSKVLRTNNKEEILIALHNFLDKGVDGLPDELAQEIHETYLDTLMDYDGDILAKSKLESVYHQAIEKMLNETAQLQMAASEEVAFYAQHERSKTAKNLLHDFNGLFNKLEDDTSDSPAPSSPQVKVQQLTLQKEWYQSAKSKTEKLNPNEKTHTLKKKLEELVEAYCNLGGKVDKEKNPINNSLWSKISCKLKLLINLIKICSRSAQQRPNNTNNFFPPSEQPEAPETKDITQPTP